MKISIYKWSLTSIVLIPNIWIKDLFLICNYVNELVDKFPLIDIKGEIILILNDI